MGLIASLPWRLLQAAAAGPSPEFVRYRGHFGRAARRRPAYQS
jgi:hypothetical protein